jgi:hypothetical protein
MRALSSPGKERDRVGFGAGWSLGWGLPGLHPYYLLINLNSYWVGPGTPRGRHGCGLNTYVRHLRARILKKNQIKLGGKIIKNERKIKNDELGRR